MVKSNRNIAISKLSIQTTLHMKEVKDINYMNKLLLHCF